MLKVGHSRASLQFGLQLIRFDLGFSEKIKQKKGVCARVWGFRASRASKA